MPSFEAFHMHLNNFQMLQSVGQGSRGTNEKYELIQDKLGAFSRSCSEVSVWCQTSTRVPIESNFYNTCPTDMKLNQSGQDMFLPVVIQFGGNPGCNKKVTFNRNSGNRLAPDTHFTAAFWKGRPACPGSAHTSCLSSWTPAQHSLTAGSYSNASDKLLKTAFSAAGSVLC